MPYRVSLTEEAAHDFAQLDGSLKTPVAYQLKTLERAPLLGKPLGKKAGLDLTGHYTLYAARRTVRIIYRIIEREVVVEVVAIGRREDLEVYREAVARLLRRR